MANPRVIVALLTKEQEYQAMQAGDAERASARAGIDVEVVYARNNAALQVEQLSQYVRKPEGSRPAAIVAQSVAGEALERVARDAVKAGIGWVLLNRDAAYVDVLRKEYPLLPIAIVTTDQLAIGRIQGRQFRSLLPKGGNVLYVQGPPDTSAAQQRLQGVREAIEGAIQLTIINGEWTEASGEKAVTSWLRLSSSQDVRLDVVGAQNDAMAVGARKAIVARRPDLASKPFTGCDGLPEGGQRLVREGQLAATVIVPSCAGPAIDLVAAQLKSGTPSAPRIVLAPKPYPENL